MSANGTRWTWCSETLADGGARKQLAVDSTLGNQVGHARVDAGQRDGNTSDTVRIRELEDRCTKVTSEHGFAPRSVAFSVNETERHEALRTMQSSETNT